MLDKKSPLLVYRRNYCQKLIFLEWMFPADFTFPHFLPSLLLIPFSCISTGSLKHSFGWHLFLFWLPQEHQISFWNSSIKTDGNLDATVIPGEHIPLLKQMLDSADQACDPSSVIRCSFLDSWANDREATERSVTYTLQQGHALLILLLYKDCQGSWFLAPLQSPWFLPISSVILPVPITLWAS